MAKGDIDNPALVVSFTKVNGKLSRTDGPAVVYANGIEYWYLDGKQHRLDGPAVTNPNTGIQEWRSNNKYHREDGPAIIGYTGGDEYWAFGIQYPSLKDLKDALKEKT